MNSTTRTILIADDEVFMRRLLDITFRKEGYRVVQARDGAEAITAAVETRPDLIVMDVMMPGLDGLDAMKQLKGAEPTAKIPVIILSSKGHALTRTEAESAGAALFFTKPFSPNQLLAEVRRILDGSMP